MRAISIRSLVFVLAALALPAQADVARVVTEHARPAFARFAGAANALDTAAQADCTAAALRPAYQAVFDTWMGVGHLGFGPLEEGGRGLAIAFWPDTRGMVGRTVARLVGEADPDVLAPAAFAEVSVAGRGLFALERLLYGTGTGYGEADYTCPLVRAQAADLARMAGALAQEWQAYGDLLLTAGQPGNAVYLAGGEAAQAVYTALMAGLEFTRDQRLGRPLGTFERPRPARAEARLSGRSLRNVILSLEALHAMARALAEGPIPATDAAFAKALERARDLGDPVFAGVAAPESRLKIEILQQSIGFARDAVAVEIGAALGLSQGFNSADGD